MGGKVPTRGKSTRQHRESSIEKIRNSQVLNRLIKHAMGEVEMTSTQVNAAKALLDKYLPNKKEVEHEVNFQGEFIVTDTPTLDGFDKEFAVEPPAGTTDSTD